MTHFNAREIAAQAKAEGGDPIATVIFQALGAASVCWDDMTNAGVFHSEEAKAIGDSVVEWLGDVGVPQRKGANDYAHIYTDEAGQWRYRTFAGNHRQIGASEDGKASRAGVLRELKREYPHINNISETREGK